MRTLVSQPFILLATCTALVFGYAEHFAGCWSLVCICLVCLFYFLFSKIFYHQQPWFLLLFLPVLGFIQLRWHSHQSMHHSSNAPHTIYLNSDQAIVQKINGFGEFVSMDVLLLPPLPALKAKIRVHNESYLARIRPGDSILLFGKITKPVINSEFDEFNYSEYLERIHIRYIDSYPTEVCDSRFKKSIDLLAMAYLSKIRIKEKFEIWIKDPEISAVMIALLLGDKSQVDQKVKMQFMNTGTAHILAVSGMHLGIIYSIGKFILMFPVRWFPMYRNILPFAHLFNIWAFTAITGFSASVVRAAVMLSMLEIGINLRKQTGSVHILSCSAFLMMMFDPCMVFDIGFQLSISAVLSILLFEAGLYKIVKGRYDWYNYLIRIITVSLAVQILVTPVSMYHFGNFPVYFLLANLFWIPLSFVLMCAGIFLLVMIPISSVVVSCTALCIEWLIKFGLFVFDRICALPSALLDQLTLFPEQVNLCLVSFIAFYIWMRSGKKTWAQLGFACFAAMILVWPLRSYCYQNGNEILFYSNTKNSILDIRQGSAVVGLRKENGMQLSASKFSRKRMTKLNFLLKIPDMDCFQIRHPLPLHGSLNFCKNQWHFNFNDDKDLNIVWFEGQKKFDSIPFAESFPTFVVIGKRNSWWFKNDAREFFKNKSTQMIELENGTQLKNF
ncbi:MAG: ComEC/Rec2 family competence protein [Saprospiraceae bacterium]|nr:ComEC/Rec2 family competence protein [Saprospiraceae bacterium]